MHTNAGSSLSHQKGMLGSILFWLNPGGLASVVALRTLEKLFHVYYDSKKNGGAFICETPGGKVVFLRCEKTGFPYINLDDPENDAAFVMVQMVRKNFSGYTRREVERAIEARKLQGRAGHPRVQHPRYY
jgi:hypothetical protein